MILSKIVDNIEQAVRCLKQKDTYAHILNVEYVMIEQKWWEVMILWRRPKYKVTYTLEDLDDILSQKTQREKQGQTGRSSNDRCKTGRCCKMPEVQ